MVSQYFDLGTLLLVALVFVSLEGLIPLRSGQKRLRAHWLNDVVFLLVNGVVVKLGLVVALTLVLTALQGAMPAALRAAVAGQPLWLQVIEAFVVADTGFYLAHRAFHASPFLWRFHAIHHSIEEMDWLAGHRVHPVDQILTKTASLAPLFMLGFSEMAIFVWGVAYQWQSVLIHANIRLDFGPLKWVLASPRFHHWHHANEQEAYDKNFAGQLPFLDAIGGTLFMPDRMPSRYGVDEPVPQRYDQQLVYPLRAAAQAAAPAAPSAGEASG
ncbi:sterol desaturase family protein [Alsobacter sp. SYSU M60028]|uniref:Sterol desaturase family protein n=1 Tax=Alsobacter ponti TaxID=2962936 RepID=A0ABT1L8R1_9HYPH|nr:sterol desaturase family protein [Alsobacter ponti]MCP8937890.1 sterol desaturase family protein [Alsobacter ponti]